MSGPDPKHELVCALKRVASELGHVPTRDEFTVHAQTSKHYVYKIFGSFQTMLRAAGLADTKREEPRKIRAADIFGRDLEEHIAQYLAKKTISLPRLDQELSIAVVGDLHFPFVDFNTLTAFYFWLAEVKPRKIVQCGDIFDMFSHSKFPSSPNLYTPKQEMELARKMAIEFWSTVRRLSPGIECHQLLGNHDVRPLKRLMETYPAGELFFNIAPFFEFEGVTTHPDAREELILDGIVFHHGFRGRLGEHRDYNLMNSVVGHTHRGGVVYRQIRNEVLWELNAGYMGDPNLKGLAYTPQKIVLWTQGWGYIDDFGPRFMAM